MNITQTTAYKTQEGKLFDHASEALAYLFRQELEVLFNGQSPFGIIKMMVEQPEVVRDKLNEYLEALDENPDVEDKAPLPIRALITQLIRKNYPEYSFTRYAYRQQGTGEWFVADRMPYPSTHGWSFDLPSTPNDAPIQLRQINFPELDELRTWAWDETLICLEDYE